MFNKGIVYDYDKNVCDNVYSRSNINQIWTLKKCKDLLDNLMFVIYPNICLFYTLHYHSTWKCKRPFKRNHSHCILLEKSKSTLQAYSNGLRVDSVCQAQNKMEKVLSIKLSHQCVGVSNIFVEFGCDGPTWTNCVPLLTDRFIYSYHAEFIPKRIKRYILLTLKPLISLPGVLVMCCC